MAKAMRAQLVKELFRMDRAIERVREGAREGLEAAAHVGFGPLAASAGWLTEKAPAGTVPANY